MKLVFDKYVSLLYGLPKIHKDNIPIRPVVSYIGAPAYELAKELNKVIKSKTSFDPTYSLKNSIQLVNKIKDLTLPGHCKLISLDVDSLFTNVPVKETLNILTKLLKNNHTNANEITELIELTKLCMKQNYFKFNNQFYQQKEGLAMGSPLSPLMADIFMDDFENKHIVKNNNILYYYRYVDDIIICWTGTDRQLDIFVKNLNNIHPKIKFKSELEQNHSINFLDLTITRVNNKHQFGIFRKPTYTDTTIPASSCHPWQHKLAAFHSYVHRLLSIPLTKENYLKELNLIYHMAQANGYNNNIVNNIIKKQKSMRIKKDLYSTAPDKINKYKSSLTYFGTVSERIAKTLKAHDIHVAFRTNNTLKNICNGKDKVNNKQKSGIYKLECSDCKATYIGQTGRKFETRYKEHIAAVRNNQPQKSHFAKHLLDSGHKLSSDHSYKILHTCDKGLRLKIYVEYSMSQIFEKHLSDVRTLRSIFGPNVPDLRTLRRRNVQMLFLNLHPIWDSNRPVPPNVVYLGGLHQKPQRELPKELKSYLDSSEHGVIYISFGTNVKPSMFHPEKLKIFTDVLSQLPYDVLWKWDKEELAGRPNNVRISKWLPQSDLLRHPKIRLFITQGGLQSTDEAITAGVPLIGVPMMNDQWLNSERYVKFNIGKRLLIEELSEKQLMDTIKTVINDDSYRQNIRKLRNVMHDQPKPPLERAVWWTEYLLRHGGAHLRAPTAHLHWTEYYQLDVVLAVVTAFVLFIALSVLFIYFIVSYVRYYTREKVKIN
ncbi:unnamed protein product [Euphydryas editha]|uniref:Reverse transcriptase domain-containing protein n=1 Tax=Euphydryas editha TaxID=104508 RepID=A0AAU9TS14_EUPED|nr:unnamed protein product [Euphydryas editha]